MPSIRFITSPGQAESREIIALYREATWWYADGDDAQDAKRLSAIVRGSHCFAVAEADGRIVAMGRAISDRFSDAYIQDVAVREDRRGQGLGTAIVEALVARLTADGLGWIGLIAERHSEHFYTRMGFSPMAGATPLLKMQP
jgi:GNAT superfamily N-acetyltransferase